MACIVSIVKDQDIKDYPKYPPFDPDIGYPEYPFSQALGEEENRIYHMVRLALWQMGWDAANYGTANWSPLSEIVKPGDIVVIKPNLVTFSEANFKSTITHGAVIRPIIDYVYIALKRNKGKIIVAEVPAQNMPLRSFNKAVHCTGLARIVSCLRERGVPIELRNCSSERRYFSGFSSKLHIERFSGDPLGNFLVDLGELSEFCGLNEMQYGYGCSYLLREEKSHFSNRKHEYSIPRTFLDANVIINMPKIKTHNIAGISGALKNVLGITDKRYWIPHWRINEISSQQQGLRFLLFKLRNFQLLGSCNQYLYKISYNIRNVEWIINRMIKKLLRIKVSERPLIEGIDWRKNDILWRVIIDLNRILFYSTKEGKISPYRQRKYLTVADGIIGGQGNNPLSAEPKVLSTICASIDPVALDIVVCDMLGLDYKKVKSVTRAERLSIFPIGSGDIDDIVIRRLDVHKLSGNKDVESNQAIKKKK